jgi:hypothetical protein
MKWTISILPFIALTLLLVASTGSTARSNQFSRIPDTDTGKNDMIFASFIAADSHSNRAEYSLKNINNVLQENKVTQFVLGQSQQGRKIDAWYFPGSSHKRALIIAGVHGSELSAVEVAYKILDQLLQGKQPFYSVVIVPALFPDNAMKALNDPELIGSMANVGRYTYPAAVDPNRQMPSPGKVYNEHLRSDHIGREIEKENQLLLELIQAFKPQRVANIHAIRNMDYGGVYADPRTDHNGLALGYTSDSSLAIQIARFIHRQGGNVAGNHLDKKPTALYYMDPAPAPKGILQKRNMTGSVLNAKRGSGVSLGTWGSTAVVNDKDVSKNRDAMRILTIEYPGYKRPVDYTFKAQQLFQHRQVELFASAINTIFLQEYFVEDASSDERPEG